MNLKQTIIPASVPENKQDLFIKNYNSITRNTDRLFIFSCDHKIEHLNKDFYSPTIHAHALHPDHLFRIAEEGNIGGMATHLGLITRYAKNYPSINYIAKLNGTTHCLPENIDDPKNLLLWNVNDVINIKNNTKLKIPAIGITVYLGNTYESEHLAQAAQIISQAHHEGLVTIAWIYIRGKHHITNNSPDLIAGACGVGVSLGADFIKIKVPSSSDALSRTQALKIAAAAAGNSKVLCAGGEKINHEQYIKELYEQIHEGDTAGTATGRNIFQHSLPEAIALTHAISAIIYDQKDHIDALTIYNQILQKKRSAISS